MKALLRRFSKIIFFDTETTGLDPEKDQIIELAAVLVTEKGIGGGSLTHFAGCQRVKSSRRRSSS